MKTNANKTNESPTDTASVLPAHLREQLHQRNKHLFETIVHRWEQRRDHSADLSPFLEQYENDVIALDSGLRLPERDATDVHRNVKGSAGRRTAVDGNSGNNDDDDDDDDGIGSPDEQRVEISNPSSNGDPPETESKNTTHRPEDNPKEKTLLELDARPYKFLESEWKAFQPGVLRLSEVTVVVDDDDQCHRADAGDDGNAATVTCRYRMVLRNSIGRVMMNLSVSKGMKFELVSKEEVGAKSGGFVRFMAVEREEVGMETFMFKVQEVKVQSLYSTLVGMVE